MVENNRYVAYKPNHIFHVSLIFIEIKFINCYSHMIFAIKLMSTCNNYINYYEIII